LQLFLVNEQKEKEKRKIRDRKEWGRENGRWEGTVDSGKSETGIQRQNENKLFAEDDGT
jgi:hypothetical protein